MKPFILILLIFTGAMLWTPYMQKQITTENLFIPDADLESSSDSTWTLIHDSVMLINRTRTWLASQDPQRLTVNDPKAESFQPAAGVRVITDPAEKYEMMKREASNTPDNTICDSAHRGMVKWFFEDMLMCVKESDGSFQWKDMKNIMQICKFSTEDCCYNPWTEPVPKEKYGVYSEVSIGFKTSKDLGIEGCEVTK